MRTRTCNTKWLSSAADMSNVRPPTTHTDEQCKTHRHDNDNDTLRKRSTNVSQRPGVSDRVMAPRKKESVLTTCVTGTLSTTVHKAT